MFNMVSRQHNCSSDDLSSRCGSQRLFIRTADAFTSLSSSYTYLGDSLEDQSNIDSIVNSTNMVANSYCSKHRSKTVDVALLRCTPDAHLQFDVNWSHHDFESSQTPPYSHDIYAVRSPSDDYPVDLNDIDAALDCDISTLDAYLHSIPCSNTNTTEFTVPEPSFKSVAYCSSHERFSSSDADPVEEFFPDLSKTFAVPCTNSSSRRRSHSSG
ncbi:hypothetical protein OSTOST_01652 [Ostertagia ostertagi]